MNQTRKILLLIFIISISLYSCKKDSGSSKTAADYSGKYQGPVIMKVNNGTGIYTLPADMIIDITNGASNTEIKFLFQNKLTIGTLTGSKFVLQGVSFSGPITTSGSGEFSDKKLTIKCTEVVGKPG